MKKVPVILQYSAFKVWQYQLPHPAFALLLDILALK